VDSGSEATFTGPSSVPVTLSPDNAFGHPVEGTPSILSVLLAGRVSGVQAGDQLLLVESTFAGQDDNDNWSLVTVTAVTPATDPGTGAVNTQVAFSTYGRGPATTPPDDPSAAPGSPGGWEPASSAPDEPSAPDGPSAAPGPGPSGDSTTYRLMRPAATAALFNAAALWNPSDPLSAGPSSEQTVTVIAGSPGSDALTVHLSAAVRGISPGDMVLFDRGAGNASALAIVTATLDMLWAVPYPVFLDQSPPSPPDIVIPHTALDLALAAPDSCVLQDAQYAHTLASIAVRYGFKDVGTIIGVPAPNLPSLPVTVATTYPPSQGNTTAFLQDTTGAGILVNVNVSETGPGLVTLTGAGTPPSAIPATTPLAVPLQLLLNVVSVSRGTTVTGEVLGSGNAALASQSFTLAKSPLTYLASGDGTASTLTVAVDQIPWQEVPSFYGQTASAHVFVVSRSPDQAVTTVTFGDGVNGARLTSGTGNVTATYRYGSGAAGPPAGRLTTISQPQLNLASVQNPVAVSGGADPQSPADVQANAPASVATFGRAISATDYEQVAARAPGVSRAAAYWTFDKAEQRTLVTVYVGDDDAAVTAAQAALAGAEDPNRPVTVTGASAIDLSLSCTLVVAAGQQAGPAKTAAEAAVSDSAGGLFSPGSMGIGQRLYRSAIDAALMVPGVAAVHDLTVTWGQQVLGEVFDPGETSYFDLPPDNVTIGGVNAGD
jgi:Baseplate J-like protein